MTNLTCQGMPYETKGSQGTEYQLDTAKVIQWRIDRMIELEHQNHQRKLKDQDDLARRKLQAETELVELKAQKVKESLVTVEDAQEAISEAVEALSDHLRTIPGTTAPLVVNQIDEHQVAQVIADVIDQTLTTIHTEALSNAKDH